MDAQEIGARLREPFPLSALGFKPQAVKGNRALAICYIDARDVMDRLDAVVGAENWQDAYEVLPTGDVFCRLSVRFGGEWITKADVGGMSDQPDQGDRLKAATSDALKRAAVKFGIGRYLYSMPQTWHDFDPVKKQFASTPPVPAEFLPRVGAPEDRARRDLKRAANLAALAAVWQALPKALQAKLLDVKDARKAEIVARQKGESAPRPGPQRPIEPGETDEDGNPIAGDLFNNDPPAGPPH